MKFVYYTVSMVFAQKSIDDFSSDQPHFYKPKSILYQQNLKLKLRSCYCDWCISFPFRSWFFFFNYQVSRALFQINLKWSFIQFFLVLHTVGLYATFWNMNCSVWDVWTVRAVREKSGFEEFWATFEGVFFNLLWSKKMFKQFQKLL